MSAEEGAGEVPGVREDGPPEATGDLLLPGGWVDLASERVGGRAVEANDEFFAPKENLVRAAAPVFEEGRYTDRGKWMDGWETRRRREPGHDWCVVRLGLPGRIRWVVVDTTHFRGNHPESCSLEALEREEGEAGDATKSAGSWREVLARSALEGDSRNVFDVGHAGRATHVRLNIYPDGGVARLRVYGEVVPDWSESGTESGPVDLAGLAAGGLVLDSSDRFFGEPVNLLLPGPPAGMWDGWETRRRRGPGHDWVVVRLGRRGEVDHVVVDTRHFKGNAPGSFLLEGCDVGEAADIGGVGDGAGARDAGGVPEIPADAAGWRELLPRTELRPDAVHRYESELTWRGPVTHARLRIFPDGGVARLRILGRPRGVP